VQENELALDIIAGKVPEGATVKVDKSDKEEKLVFQVVEGE